MMTTPEIFEFAMISCLSISRHVSLWRVVRDGSNAPGNITVLTFVLIAYSLGLGGKLAMWYDTGVMSPITFFYIWTLVVCAADFALTRSAMRQSRGQALLPI